MGGLVRKGRVREMCIGAEGVSEETLEVGRCVYIVSGAPDTVITFKGFFYFEPPAMAPH